MVDAASGGILTFTGGKAGAALGLIFIGPAGALILGLAIATTALLGTSNMRELIERGLHREWYQGVLADAARLDEALREPLERRVRLLRERSATIVGRTSHMDPDLRDWMDARASDEVIAAADTMLALDSGPRSVAEVVTLGLQATRVAPTDVAVIRACEALRNRIYSEPSLTLGVVNLTAQLGDGVAGWAAKPSIES